MNRAQNHSQQLRDISLEDSGREDSTLRTTRSTGAGRSSTAGDGEGGGGSHGPAGEKKEEEGVRLCIGEEAPPPILATSVKNLEEVDDLLIRFPNEEELEVRRLPTRAAAAHSLPLPSLSLTLPLYGAISFSPTSVVYMAVLGTQDIEDPGSELAVLKMSQPGAEEEVLREGRLLTEDKKDLLKGYVAPALGLFEGDDGMVALLSEYGGLPPARGRWRDFSEAQRLSLFLSLLHLHQQARILHGDVRPPNAVAPWSEDGAFTRPVWIDLGRFEHHPECLGKQCPELSRALYAMELQGIQGELETSAAATGLRFE
ncbi:hypothetical protein JCM10213_008707 [Rhodosporidiobolus nylandii]